jgi:hypothetical protein
LKPKRTGWQQTGFRADKDLLNRFRSKLALEGRDMGPVIEGFIVRYVEGAEGAEGPLSVVETPQKEAPGTEPEWELVNEVLTVIRSGGDAADLLRRTTATLLRMARLEAAGDGTGIETGTHETHTQNRAGNPVADHRIEEAERLAENIRREAEENRTPSPQRAATGKGTHGGRKKLGS